MPIYKLPTAYKAYTEPATLQVAANQAHRPRASALPRLVHVSKAHPPAALPGALPAHDNYGRLCARFLNPAGEAHTLTMTTSWVPPIEADQRFEALSELLSRYGCTLLEVQRTVQVGVEL